MREFYPGLLAHVPPAGLTILVEPMSQARSVALGFWLRVGSRDDPQGKEGLAHLVEHMVFKGTAHRSAREIAQVIDALGGHLNGATAKEHTFYYTSVLAEDLFPALEILTEMVTEPHFSPEDLGRERMVVLEEIREAEDDPADTAFRLLLGRLWGGPLGQPTLGTPDAVAGLGADDLWALFRRHYLPQGAVLVACGAVRPDGLLAPWNKVQKSYSTGLAQGERLRPADGPPPSRQPPVPQGGLVVEERDINQVHLAVGFPTVPAGAEERYGLEVLNALLGGGMSSLLFQLVREERGLAYTVFSSTTYYTDAGGLLIYAATEEPHLPEVIATIFGVLERIARTPPTQADLKRAVERLRGSFLLGLEGPVGRLLRLGTAWALGQEILPPEEVVRKLWAVSPDEVQDLARRFLRPEAAALALVGPKGGGFQEMGRAALGVADA